MFEDILQPLHAGRLDEAEARCRARLAANADDAEVLHLLAIVRRQQGDAAEAHALLERALALAPDNELFHLTLGRLAAAGGALGAAAEAFARARELNPNLAGAHSGLGKLALMQGDLAAAEALFWTAHRADDNDDEALAGLGHLHAERGDFAMAVRFLTRAVERRPDDALLQLSLGRALLGQGMHEFAAQAFSNALRLKPGFAGAGLMLGLTELRRKRYDKAEEAYRAVIAMDAGNAQAHGGLGDVLRARGRNDLAMTAYARAIELDDGYDNAATAYLWCRTRTGDRAGAYAFARDWLARRPDAHIVRRTWAELLDEEGQREEALALWRGRIAEAPDDARARAALALLLERSGALEEAAAEAERSAAGARYGEVDLLRARAALREGDAERALALARDADTGALTAAQRRQRLQLIGLAHDRSRRHADALQAFRDAQAVDAAPLPALLARAALEPALAPLLALPPLAQPRAPAPVLLAGLPGSGVERIAALLADQPGVRLRGDRFEGHADFFAEANDARLLKPLSDGELAVLARRYERALLRRGGADGRVLVDWLPHLDARLLPAIRRALPGARLLVVDRNAEDALLNWLAFGWSAGYAIADVDAAAAWLKRAGEQLDLAAAALPALRVDADALLAAPAEAGGALAAFLGLDALAPGARFAQSARSTLGGLPTAFPPGHAAAYREALASAFAALR
ncbi:TPR repeat-containing protein [Mizugakiibacter sediminis]|uniref:TPR repeat-containing protein n=1 Tax=Mizugakiibacter sediminis TaxID=1475481 RepID=A0A0K8QKT9_9GAMM|nr:tetratricopeptide repeat protein [Mizugakiibacter sediminis]GAP65281.1 TPR repeat-containing protein [Mizugakiibacter sediminis]